MGTQNGMCEWRSVSYSISHLELHRMHRRRYHVHISSSETFRHCSLFKSTPASTHERAISQTWRFETRPRLSTTTNIHVVSADDVGVVLDVLGVDARAEQRHVPPLLERHSQPLVIPVPHQLLYRPVCVGSKRSRGAEKLAIRNRQHNIRCRYTGSQSRVAVQAWMCARNAKRQRTLRRIREPPMQCAPCPKWKPRSWGHHIRLAQAHVCEDVAVCVERVRGLGESQRVDDALALQSKQQHAPLAAPHRILPRDN